MNIWAIDPGSEESALVVLDASRLAVIEHVTESNPQLRLRLRTASREAVLVVESFESYGMAVGAEVFRTVWWSGRFHEAWQTGSAFQLSRRAVKLHICHSARATDSNVRQAIIDRFGETKEKAIGRKASRGPLFGIKGHEYAALAVALTWADTHGKALSEAS